MLGGKNLLVASLVGLRKTSERLVSDDAKKKEAPASASAAAAAAAAAKSQSGHVCVVQAMVHQDGEMTSSIQRPTAARPAGHAAGAGPAAPNELMQEAPRRPTTLLSHSSSIELTVEQVGSYLRRRYDVTS